MIRRLALLLVGFFLSGGIADAQVYVPPVNSVIPNCSSGQYLSISGGGFSCTPTGTLTFPAASPLDPVANKGAVAFVPDAGIGPCLEYSDGTYWETIGLGQATQIASGSTVNITPGLSPQLYILTGSNSTLNTTFNVSANPAPWKGFTVKMIYPPGVLAVAATVGINTGTGNTLLLPISQGSSTVQFDGLKFVNISN